MPAIKKIIFLKRNIILILFFFIILLSCKSKEKKLDINENIESIPVINESNPKIEENNSNENIPIDDLFDLNFYYISNLQLIRFNDEDMIQNITIIYRIESDVIENIDEIEPNQIVNEILDKPFEEIEISMVSAYSNKDYYNNKIEEFLHVFRINPSNKLVENFNSLKSYELIEFQINNLNIFVDKAHGTSFSLFSIEYDNDSFYEPKLKIGSTKNDILQLLGMPSAYSDERNVFVYNSKKTLRQINIFFDDDNKTKLIQLIAFFGI
jgi:outer membrane protein assembly factor BamE (lipoprotein component of BamABCDE complex)